MEPRIINFLNQLNFQFYQTVATDFSDSRKVAWEGWQKLLPDLQQLADQNQDHALSVLDVGCGNGRFYQFITQKLKDVSIKYLGIDNSLELLKLAREEFTGSAKFQEFDLVNQEIGELKAQFEVITLFGVLHHLPGFELRKKLVAELAQSLAVGGLLVVTTWQFTDSLSLMNRTIEPQLLGLTADDLEPNDYILDWQRGTQAQPAYRFCHLTTDQEMAQLIAPTDLELKTQFWADKYNHYFVLQKK